MHNADQSPVRKDVLQPSRSKHVPRSRNMGDFTIESDENAVFDECPRLGSSKDITGPDWQASYMVGRKAG